MAKAIHSMIRVLDEARSVDFYRAAFGLEPADRFEFDGFTLVYLRGPEADFEIELTINNGRTEPYALGDGYGHVAFAVTSVDEARQLGVAQPLVIRAGRGEADGRARSGAEREIELSGDPAQQRRLQPKGSALSGYGKSHG